MSAEEYASLLVRQIVDGELSTYQALLLAMKWAKQQ